MLAEVLFALVYLDLTPVPAVAGDAGAEVAVHSVLPSHIQCKSNSSPPYLTGRPVHAGLCSALVHIHLAVAAAVAGPAVAEEVQHEVLALAAVQTGVATAVGDVLRPVKYYHTFCSTY